MLITKKLWLGQPLWNHKNTKTKYKNLSISAAIPSVFSFLYSIMLRFWGSNMLQRGDYAREICYFVVVDASPFPLQPVVCIIYFSFPACLRWP